MPVHGLCSRMSRELCYTEDLPVYFLVKRYAILRICLFIFLKRCAILRICLFIFLKMCYTEDLPVYFFKDVLY